MTEDEKKLSIAQINEKIRWEPTYRNLGPWRDRRPPSAENSSEVVSYVSNFSPKRTTRRRPTIKTTTDARLIQERKRKEKLEADFHDRIDRTILRAIYTEDNKAVKQICA